MKITMTGRDFNRIMQVCRPALDRNGIREALNHIEIRCKDGVGVASACDGFVMAQCQFDYKGDDGAFLLCSNRTVKNESNVSIVVSANGKKISIADDSEITTRNACTDEYINLQEVVSRYEKKKQRAGFTINVAQLRRILDSFPKDDNAVLFEIRGEEDAVIIRGRETYALILPVRLHGEKEFATFARPVYLASEGGGKA